MCLWSFHHWAGQLYSLLFPTEREKNIHRGKYIEMNFRVHEQREVHGGISVGILLLLQSWVMIGKNIPLYGRNAAEKSKYTIAGYLNINKAE